MSLATFLSFSIYSVPPEVAGTTKRVRIGWQRPYSSQQPGRYAMQFLGSMNACGLRKDGTWGKYGDAFDTEQEAFDTLMASPYADVYDRWEEQEAVHEGRTDAFDVCTRPEQRHLSSRW